jgi:ribosomal protein L11 methyltransferase
MMNWLEVSMTVDGELAEAVADVFARYAPGGVVAEHGIKYMDADDPGTPTDDVIVRAYLPADARLEETRQRLEQGLSYLNMIQALPAPRFTPIKESNWMEAWKQHYRPLEIGKKLIIVPAWMGIPEDDRVQIKIDPGMAFGTGTHPTTQLALALIEDVIAEDAPQRIIDVGCGSGILSVAALKLGVEKALGVDIEEASVKSSRENADVNEIGSEFVIGQGSVDEILAGEFEFRSAPLVVANILAPILIRLMEAGMGTLVTPGGKLILSGILDEKEADIRAALEKYQLDILERRQMGDWIAFVVRPRP